MAKLFGKKDADNLSKKRIEQIAPLAKEIIKLVAESDLEIGDVHAHDNDKYNAVAKKILEMLLEKEVKYVDKDFLFQLILQPFDRLREIILTSLRMSFDRVIEKSLKKEYREVTLKDMDKMIKGE